MSPPSAFDGVADGACDHQACDQQAEPPLFVLKSLQQALCDAEQSIDLLGCLCPTNFRGLVRQHSELLARRQSLPEPEFTYRAIPDTSRANYILQEAGTMVDSLQVRYGCGLWLRLLGQRREEVEIQRLIVEHRGSAQVGRLALRLYDVEPTDMALATELAERWLTAPVPAEQAGERRVELAAELERHNARLAEPVPIIERNLVSRAAAGFSELYVQRGARVTRREAARVFVHEFLGHLLVRRSARRCSLPVLIGARGSLMDEEGRAILLEQRFGLLAAGRRRELATRHVACLFLWRSFSHDDAVRRLVEQGADPEQAVAASLRARRGGGLSREVCYLPGLIRVQRAFGERPDLEPWLACTRLTVEWARKLADSSRWEGLLGEAGSVAQLGAAAQREVQRLQLQLCA